MSKFRGEGNTEYVIEKPTEEWRQFLNMWWDVGTTAFADLSSGGQGSVEEYLSRILSPPEDPPIPEDILSGRLAHKHVFGRTDLGDYRNSIKNVYGQKVGVTVHVKRAFERNILTIEDFGGECPMINIVTKSGKTLTLNVSKIPVDGTGEIETRKLEI
jgi:hypothetical protein